MRKNAWFTPRNAVRWEAISATVAGRMVCTAFVALNSMGDQKMLTSQPALAQLAVAALVTVPYNAALVHLTKGSIPLGPNLTLAECTAVEADFTGYAAVALPASAPVPYPDPVQQGVSWTLPTVNFTVGATPTGNDVTGMYVVSSTGHLLWAGSFQSPYPMQNAGDAMNVESTMNMFGTDAISATINGNPA